MIDLERVLCPIDFSDTSRRALSHAIAISKWYGSQLTALHVVQAPFIVQPPILFAEFGKTTLTADVDRHRAEAELRQWLEPAVEAGIATEIIVDEGTPSAKIFEHARSLPADLVVLGTHGITGFERLILGSVAEKVLRRAPCPVLTIPPSAGAADGLPYKRVLCPVDFSDSALEALQFACSLASESDGHLTVLHVLNWIHDEELIVQRFDATEFHRFIEKQTQDRLDALVTDELRQWCTVETKMSHGKPYREILNVATAEKSDLIVIGVRGRNPLDIGLFGSTTNQVVRRAPCPVLTLSRQ